MTVLFAGALAYFEKKEFHLITFCDSTFSIITLLIVWNVFSPNNGWSDFTNGIVIAVSVLQVVLFCDSFFLVLTL
jgi:hypothetical protein